VTVAEIIAEQRRKCEADKAAKLRMAAEKAHAPAPAPRKMTPAEVERAFLEDRTYGGKAPDGGMLRTMRKENPEEYVARDGTRTFVPWRYVSMQDLELPSGDNPYRPQQEEPRKPADPWARPSGYVASDQGGMYDPWAAPGGTGAQQGTGGGWDDWLAPQEHQPALQPENGWLAPQEQHMAPQPAELKPDVTGSMPGAGGALDLMRNMRR
jgi:hypothetical protein